MTAHRPVTPALRESFERNRAAIDAVRVHDRMETFATIGRICDQLARWGKDYEDEARLALAYALDDVLETNADEIAELETECGIDHEFGHVYCTRRDAFKRKWGLA